MESKVNSRESGKDTFSVFVNCFEAVVKNDFDKFCKASPMLTDKNEFLENIKGWALERCSCTFKDQLFKTVDDFSSGGNFGCLSQMDDIVRERNTENVRIERELSL